MCEDCILTLRKANIARGRWTPPNFAAWIRRQSWLRAVYRYFPRGARNRAFALLARSVARQVRFAPLPPSTNRIDPTPSAFAVQCKIPPTLPGLNIFAYFRGEFGLGEGARLYSRALLESGYAVSLNEINIDLPHGLSDQSMSGDITTEAPYAVNLIFANPDRFADALASIGRAKLDGRYVIAGWFWELEDIPDGWSSSLDLVDEILVSSTFVEQAFRRATDKPVLRVPLPINGVSDSGLKREDFGLSHDTFVFLSSFDFNSSLARKNPFAVIDAFRKAFPRKRSDVQLLLKSSNGHRYPRQLFKLLDAAASDHRIIVRDEVIQRAHIGALQRCANAYISLHRAEGFGLGLAECMSIGKPVVGTAWSGNLDFMSSTNSCLVDCRFVPVGKDEYPHPTGARWAEPDVENAAAHMRRLVDEPLFARRIGEQAAADIQNMLSPRQATRIIIDRLSQLDYGNSKN